jgi:hypothetical protein
METGFQLKMDAPKISARFSPVYWEPMTGSAERITALVAIEPEPGQSDLIPAAHLILPFKRLKGILGPARGNSAFGILNEVAEFMTSRLVAGLTLEELDAPFAGFTVGKARAIKAFSEAQLLSGAVQMVSALGDIDDILEDDTFGARSTSTTMAFLKLVQTAFSHDVKDRRSRFFKAMESDGAKRVTVDYAYQKWLVQFASLPSTVGQAPYVRREAESKILELITARDFVESPTETILIINRQPIIHTSEGIASTVAEANESLKWFAKRYDVHPIEVKSTDAAVLALEQLS